MQSGQTFRVQSLVQRVLRIQNWRSILQRVQRASRGPTLLARRPICILCTRATRWKTTSRREIAGDDVDLVVWFWGIFVVREIVVLNAITTATTHKKPCVASLQIFMSSHFIGSDSVASHQRGIAIVGFVETQLEGMNR